MQINCPSCGVELKVKESLVGRRVKCPKCQEPISVETPPEEYEEPEEFFEQDAPPPPPPPRRAVSSLKSVNCPMCGAKNPETVADCLACGESLLPGSIGSLRSGGGPGVNGVWRDGKLLVMSKTATLPYRCVKTNTPATTSLKRKLSWHNPLLFVLVFIGVLIYAIVALAVRKQAEIMVPVCERIRKRRFMFLVAAWCTGLGGVGVTVLGIAISAGSSAHNNSSGELVGFLIGGGLLTAIFGTIVCLMFSNVLTPAKITDHHAWLKGVHPDYLATLPKWPGG
jgi:hypothetical protein